VKLKATPFIESAYLPLKISALGKIFLPITYREELTIDYGWDKDEFNIPEHVLCLCEKPKCRKYLMRAKSIN